MHFTFYLDAAAGLSEQDEAQQPRMSKNPICAAVPKNRRQPGFTLVELLIVIVIIAALAALIFGMSKKMIQKAQRVNALSALKQVATANVAYSTENFGNINTMRFTGDPMEGSQSGPNAGLWVSNTFWGRCSPYLFSGISAQNESNLNKELKLRINDLFSTPDSSKMTKTVISGARIYHDSSGLPVPISFNSKLFPWGKFVKVSSVESPSEIMWATYGFSSFNETSGQSYVKRPTNGTSANIYYMDDRKALAAFLDGHIEELAPAISRRRF